jgi:YidC/Oxa1 family membrane protein insertase
VGALWQSFQQVIFEALRYIEGYVGDWGMSIIVLTVFVRLLLMPLTIKQTRSMYELQKIQPKIKELQKKYKDNKEKLQEETLKFYQDNKVNPFGGCLPAILQMPLLIALYWVIGGTADRPGLLVTYLRDQDLVGSFYWIIADISRTPGAVFREDGLVSALPYLILVALFSISIWLPQALMPGDKQQKMIGAYMAVVMLWFGWISPAGVLLYWDVSSLWGVGQQQIMIRYMKKHSEDEKDEAPPEIEEVAAAPQKPKPKKKSGKKK